MNDHEFEELLSKAPVFADDVDDLKLRLLSHLASSDAPRLLEGRIRSWRRIAATGWAVAGITVLAALLPAIRPRPSPPADSTEVSVVTDEFPGGGASDELTFQVDDAEQTRRFKHPWSSTVVLLADLPSEQQETLPVQGRFVASVSQ